VTVSRARRAHRAARRPPRIAHVALWTRDLERLRAFYVALLGGRARAKYVNARAGFESYFVEFGRGARLELMTSGSVAERASGAASVGYAHVALSLGSRRAVDALVARLGEKGVRVLGAPRVTGDGYYEAVIEDPDGNAVEIAA
jgi:lactoylglutathione lyase